MHHHTATNVRVNVLNTTKGCYNQNKTYNDGDICVVYHIDHVEARTYITILRLVTWMYGFALMFLTWMRIFDNIGKANIGMFSIQIIYVLFIYTLSYRQHLRHIVISLLFTLFALVFNACMTVSFTYRLVECRWYELCNDNGNAFLWATGIIATLFVFNLITVFISIMVYFIIHKHKNCKYKNVNSDEINATPSYIDTGGLKIPYNKNNAY